MRIPQTEFTPDRLASEISAQAAEPQRLAEMAGKACGVVRWTQPNASPTWSRR
jgi:UDP-N-acetylglucosamine--N-acetylmuramyl-(pentapeptide) pyrophosphoryl-undecaprenol N-acetylglucosamine transferase